jgi:DNA repair exonuclease SbcCD ATPase subunit
MGEHFHGMTRQAIARQDVEAAAAHWLSTLGERIGQLAVQARESTARRDAAVRKALRARMRAFREVQRKLRRLGPEARDAGVAAYRNLVERVDRELAAHLPSWVPRGAERLAELRESFNGEVVRLRQRYARVWHRAGVRIDDLQRMVKERREILRAARRRVRELPAEYRLLGRAEVESLRDALDSMIPAQLPAPA